MAYVENLAKFLFPAGRMRSAVTRFLDDVWRKQSATTVGACIRDGGGSEAVRFTKVVDHA